MKRTLYIAIAAIAGAAAFYGCQKDDDTTAGVPKGEEMILDIKGISWDSSQSDVEEYLRAGVFAVQESGELSGQRYVDNAEFIKRAGLFYGLVPVMYPEESARIVAYIPYGSISLPEGEKMAAVSVKKDQSNISDYVASDFMSAVANVEKGKKGSSSMTMKRLFSKVNIELYSGSIASGDLVNSLLEMTLNTSASVDLAAGNVSSASDPGRIIPRGRLKENDGVCSGLTFITVPQQIKADAQCIHLTVNGEKSDYSLGEEKSLESGMEYTFSVFVNKVGDRYSLDIMITEKPWESGLELDFEVDQEVEEIKPVSDIDGNVYQVVKVGAQYWMTSNLMVTKYNDGTPIDFISTKEKWAEVAETKKGAYCVYNDDMEFKSDYGYLYNWHAVDTDKLCPEGWKVPTLTEFMMYINELGGEQLAGNLMKATSGWRGYKNDEKPDYQGTNESGFDGRPGGYRSDAGACLNEGKYGYWWCSSTQNGSTGDAIYLFFNSPGVFKTSALFRTGYSVRCIKY